MNEDTIDCEFSKKGYISVSAWNKSKENINLTLSHPIPISKGAFGSVFKAQLTLSQSDSEETVAVKRVVYNPKCKDREFDLLSDLSHPFIVELLYFFRTHNALSGTTLHYFVFEYLPGSLSEYIQQRRGICGYIFPPEDLRIYLYQLFQALDYIHSKNICHRDIKPQNILLDDFKKVAKLCDFGSAKILVQNGSNIHYICSRFYRAPELIIGMSQYDTKIDMWSMGCVIAEMIEGEPLFCSDTCIGVLDKIIRLIGTPTTAEINEMNPAYKSMEKPLTSVLVPMKLENRILRQIEKELLKILQNLIVYSPSKRFSGAQCLEMPYFSILKSSSSLMPKCTNGR